MGAISSQSSSHEFLGRQYSFEYSYILQFYFIDLVILKQDCRPDMTQIIAEFFLALNTWLVLVLLPFG